MRVAVLGSSSFAGCDFVDLLLDAGGYEILGIGRSARTSPAPGDGGSAFVYRRLDLNDDLEEIGAALDDFAPEYVVNFAAQGDDAASWAHPADFFQTNCVAAARLVDHLKERAYLRRFLQISSSGVYGTPPYPLREDSRLQPGSPYAVSKAAADLLLLAYHENYGFPALIMRPPNLYGPHQQLFRIIPKTIVLLERGETVELHGGGRAVRSYLYVRDASRAALTILERGEPGAAYNAAPDERRSIREIVAAVCELLGKDFAAETTDVEDRRGQQSAQELDSAALRRLGWSPQVGLRDGIAEVVRWIRRDWNQLVNEQLAYTHKQ